MLIVNQKNAAAGSWFTVGEDNTAKVTFADGSYLGIVNATEGTVQLAGTVTNNGAKVVTDNRSSQAPSAPATRPIRSSRPSTLNPVSAPSPPPAFRPWPVAPTSS